MGKRILRVYLAKNDTPYSAAYAKLDLPASPWEVWDAMEKVRLQTDDILYMEIEDYYAFEYLSPHLDGLDISLNELNDLAALLSALDEVQGIAFEGLFSMEVQRKVNANGGVITLQDLRDLAVSAKTDCYHVVDAADDAALGLFYAENDFIPELDGVLDAVFKMLDFAGIGRMMRHGENGVFVGNLYVLQDGELTTAPPVQKTLPEKPGYLFRLTLGLHPDIGDARTVTLDLPAAEAELLDALNKELAEKGGSLIGVNTFTLDGDEAAISEAKDVLAKKGATYQNVYFDSDGEAGKFTTNIFAYPTTYVVDRSGNIVGEPIVGAITEKKQAETLQKLIDQALAADMG